MALAMASDVSGSWQRRRLWQKQQRM